jgi:hypothetical protein
MIKQGTLNSDILDIVRYGGSLTCAQIVAELEVGTRKKLDSASVSSVLFAMVQKGYLKYSTTQKGPKGGHVYELGVEKQTKRLVLKFKISNGPTSNH